MTYGTGVQNSIVALYNSMKQTSSYLFLKFIQKRKNYMKTLGVLLRRKQKHIRLKRFQMLPQDGASPVQLGCLATSGG